MSMQAEIETRLSAELKPSVMQVINESNNHNVPPGSESHFKLVLVSDRFDGKPLLARHRLINHILQQQLQNGIHALAIHTYTESEWRQLQGDAPESPACHGGEK
ncbi:MAG TPA: BolA/IbaG family iron-sulfur metabolism protein [Gammaproteobacteria bacterium]|nr:BolA/IbaG family iron-sulfur metabolism protein [Gammaproteobacteria bacterium]